MILILKNKKSIKVHIHIYRKSQKDIHKKKYFTYEIKIENQKARFCLVRLHKIKIYYYLTYTYKYGLIYVYELIKGDNHGKNDYLYP
jgi:hypothetical protein